MTKMDIAERVALQLGYTKKDAAKLVEMALGVMKNVLESGEELKIAGFGKFIVRSKRHRPGRNPRTGEAVMVAARKSLSFRPSKMLIDSVNKD